MHERQSLAPADFRIVKWEILTMPRVFFSALNITTPILFRLRRPPLVISVSDEGKEARIMVLSMRPASLKGHRSYRASNPVNLLTVVPGSFSMRVYRMYHSRQRPTSLIFAFLVCWPRGRVSTNNGQLQEPAAPRFHSAQDHLGCDLVGSSRRRSAGYFPIWNSI